MLKCFFENGYEASLRHVVVDAIALKDQKILLVKRAPHLSNGGKYAMPGGFLDRDETTREAVLRELLEETGHTGTITELFRVEDEPHRRDDDRQNVSFVYVIEVGEKIQEPDQESSEVKWFSLDALPPQEEFAFDHLGLIQQYLQQRKVLE